MQRIKKLKSLYGYLNSSEFSLDIVLSMSAADILSKIQQMGMQNKNALYIQQAFQKIKHVYTGNIPNDATVLNDKFDGIGMKFALLVVQYIHGLIQVSDFFQYMFSPYNSGSNIILLSSNRVFL